jgi:hypothetical protein
MASQRTSARLITSSIVAHFAVGGSDTQPGGIQRACGQSSCSLCGQHTRRPLGAPGLDGWGRASISSLSSRSDRTSTKFRQRCLLFNKVWTQGVSHGNHKDCI